MLKLEQLESRCNPTPIITVADKAIFEGNSGNRSLVFTVQLSEASLSPVTVDYATADDTAMVADNDYVAKSGTLMFSPRVIQARIFVTIRGDLTPEADETLFVNLRNPVGAVIGDAQAVGTIWNDDAGFFAFDAGDLRKLWAD